MATELTIGRVADETGVAATTLRYYEQIGLVPVPVRVGGQRRYDDSVLARLEVIGLCKSAGFTLDEIVVLFADDAPGRRYPLVIQTHGFREKSFDPAGVFPSAFAAQELAAADIVVLQVEDCPIRSTADEASCQIAGYKAAIKQLAASGLIDSDRVGIIGFSRTCYYVMAALTDPTLHLRAASITDGIILGYVQYMMSWNVWNNENAHEENIMIGAPPFGKGLEDWLKHSPEFNLDKVSAPLQIVAIGRQSALAMWEPYAGLNYLNKPADFVLLPGVGTHVLTNPAQRAASQTGTAAA